MSSFMDDKDTEEESLQQIGTSSAKKTMGMRKMMQMTMRAITPMKVSKRR